MALAGLVILAAGITLGIAGTMLVVQPGKFRPPMPADRAVEFMVMRFKEELNLSPEQANLLRGILSTRMKKLGEIREKARPEIEEQLELLKSEVREVLSPEQQERLQEITERLDRMFRRGMHRGPGGRGRPGPGGPGERFREGRGPFRGPRRPDPNDPNGPRDWQREGRRPPWMRRPDANKVPPPPESVQDEERTGAEQEPNQPS
jgi:uncharacterized membrane protein